MEGGMEGGSEEGTYLEGRMLGGEKLLEGLRLHHQRRGVDTVGRGEDGGRGGEE